MASLSALRTADSLVLSPLNIFSSLMILYIGARGKTETDMRSAMKLSSLRRDETNTLHSELLDDLERVKDLHMTYKLFVTEAAKAKPSFEDFIETLNFSNPEKAQNHINLWFERDMNRAYETLFDEGMEIGYVRNLLVAGLHFRAAWEELFYEEMTKEEYFWMNRTHMGVVEMMHNLPSDMFLYASFWTMGFHLLELPYKGGKFSALIVLPVDRNGLDDLLKKLPSIQKTILNAEMFEQEVEVGIPKVNIENAVELTDVLKEMGMKAPFEPNANFELLESSSILRISQVWSKTRWDINEGGSEYGVSRLRVIEDWIQPDPSPTQVPPPAKFNANHSFLFYVVESESRLPLLMGIVRNPYPSREDWTNECSETILDRVIRFFKELF